MRKRIYEIVGKAREGDRISVIYDSCMMLLIVLSLVPLAFKESNLFFECINTVANAVFVVDYLLRLWTADLKLKRGALSFVIYPFTPMAINDLIAILPVFLTALPGLRLVKLFRLFRTFRVFRSFKIFRHTKSVWIIVDVIKKQKAPLLAVCSMAFGYVLISALIIFNVESETFSISLRPSIGRSSA